MTLFDVEIVTISDDLHYWPAILNFYPLLKILNFAKYDGRALFCYLYWPLIKCLEIHLSAAVLLYSCNLIKKKCSVSPCHLLAFKRFNRSKKKYMGKSLVFKDPVLIFHEKKTQSSVSGLFRQVSKANSSQSLVWRFCLPLFNHDNTLSQTLQISVPLLYGPSFPYDFVFIQGCLICMGLKWSFNSDLRNYVSQIINAFVQPRKLVVYINAQGNLRYNACDQAHRHEYIHKRTKTLIRLERPWTSSRFFICHFQFQKLISQPGDISWIVDQQCA